MKNIFLIFIAVILGGTVLAQPGETVFSYITSQNEPAKTPKDDPKTTNYWTGNFNHLWGNAQNWSLGSIPGAGDDVNIPNVNMPCIVDYSDKSCHNITIQAGAAITIYDQALNVTGNADVYGAFNLNSTYSALNIDGDIIWEAGSTGYMFGASVITIEGNWNFQDGANVQFIYGYVDFTGSATSYIRCYESNCSFNNIRNNKTASVLGISGLSTEDLHIGGNIYNYSNCTFASFSTHSVILDGFFNNMDGHINCPYGTFVFNGYTSNVPLKPTAGDYFNNLTINLSSGSLKLDYTYYGGLTIKGDLLISGGTFDSNGLDISIGGNWTNTVGSSGFIPGIGYVIFNGGNYHQYCSGETFTTIEINKPDGGALRINGGDVVCENYFFDAGAIDVLSGSFTVTNKMDYEIDGVFYLNEGGTINLSRNDNFSFLDCDLFIYGGTMNIYGNSDYLWWSPYDAMHITMSSGVLDFHDNGIGIPDNGLTNNTINITGGVIRTSKGFKGETSDFQPTAGTFEFYGTSDSYISQSNGCTLFNVEIYKYNTESSIPANMTLTKDERLKTAISTGSNPNILLNSDFVITNDLTIATIGEVKLNGHELTVVHNCYNTHGTLTMDNANDVLNVGTDELIDGLWFFCGSVGAISSGTINLSTLIIDTCSSFIATTASVINFSNNFYFGYIENKSSNTLLGNIIVDMQPGSHCLLYGTEPFIVNGDFTVNASNIVEIGDQTLIVHGVLTDNASSEIYAYNTTLEGKSNIWKEIDENPTSKSKSGTLEIDSDFTLNGLLDIGDGNVQVHGIFGTASTGNVVINGGSLIADAQNHSKGWETLNGGLEINDGLFEITHNSFKFGSTANNNVSGGILRSGGAFYALNLNVFQPTGGVVEITGSEPDNIIYCTNGNYFYDLTINRDPGVSTSIQSGDIIVKNDLTINSGVLNSEGYDINVGGNWTNNVGPGGFVESSGTVTFNGNGNASVTTNETFNNLWLDKTYAGYNGLSLSSGISVTVTNDLFIYDGTLEMNNNSTLDIGGNVYIANDAGFNANNDTGLSIFVGGSWNDENTSNSITTGYYPGTEVITFDGNGNQQITTNSSQIEFGNLVINKSSGTFLPHKNIYVLGNFMLSDGEWADFTNGLSHYFEGDFIVETGGKFNNSANKNSVNLISDKDATIAIVYPSTDNCFNILNIDKSTITKTLDNSKQDFQAIKGTKDDPKTTEVVMTSKIVCINEMTIEEASLYFNGNTLETGDLNINTGGIVNAMVAAVIKIKSGKSININDGGILNVIGSGGFSSKITHNNSGYYGFNVESGGTINVTSGILEYIDGYGVNVKSGAIANFINCTFRNVFPGPYSSDITLDNDQIIDCYGVVFYDNPGYNVYKSNDAGEINFHYATGDFAGPEYEYDPNGHVNWTDMNIDIALNVVLEGPYNGTDMNTDLNTLGLIPLSQPFNSISTADWYYTGTESVGSIPANVVDWVLVQIRDASNAGSADETTVVAEQAAFLLNNGSVVDLDGSGDLYFSGITYSNGLFPVVWHRNHLGVISANRMTKSGGVYYYDFTISGSAYNAGEKNLGGGVFGLFSGDAAGDGGVNNIDILNWGSNAGQKGYYPGDMNLDSQVENVDKNDFSVTNFGNQSQIPESK